MVIRTWLIQQSHYAERSSFFMKHSLVIIIFFRCWTYQYLQLSWTIKVSLSMWIYMQNIIQSLWTKYIPVMLEHSTCHQSFTSFQVSQLGLKHLLVKLPHCPLVILECIIFLTKISLQTLNHPSLSLSHCLMPRLCLYLCSVIHTHHEQSVHISL